MPSFNKHLSSTYYMSGTVPGAWRIYLSQGPFQNIFILVGRGDNKPVNKTDSACDKKHMEETARAHFKASLGSYLS